MSKTSPLLSIIVPVYNSEEYLNKAFDTVLSQSFGDFELILVNDGSTDNSAEVCRKYAQNDKRVRFYNKENGGLCSARNYGLEYATGKYIMFMDNDDEYCPDAFNIIANAIKVYNTDIIRFNRKRIQIFDDGRQKNDIFGTKGVSDDTPVLMLRKQFFEKYTTIRKSGCFAGIWNGAFRKELFKDIRFDETITSGGEDAIVNLQLYGEFRTILFMPDVLYVYYRRTKHSVSTQFQKNHIIALDKESTIERQLIKDNGLTENEYYSFAYVYIASLIKVLNHKNSNMSNEEKFKVLDELKEKSYGFQITIAELKNVRLFYLYKLYLSLYAKRNYYLLFTVTNIIMKIRGNS